MHYKNIYNKLIYVTNSQKVKLSYYYAKQNEDPILKLNK